MVFVSSAFVPVAGMASFLQPIARANPVTVWCNLARYLANGLPGIIDFDTKLPVDTFQGLLVKSVLWIVGPVGDLRPARGPALPQASRSSPRRLSSAPGSADNSCMAMQEVVCADCGAINQWVADVVLALPRAALRPFGRSGPAPNPRPTPRHRHRLAVRPPKDPPAGTDPSYPWFPLRIAPVGA